MLGGRYADARDAFEALLAAGIDDSLRPRVMLELGAAHEALGSRERARDLYREIAKLYPGTSDARVATIRELFVLAYLEEWKSLGAAADRLLARKDIDKVDRMTALGSRALGQIEQGDVRHAARDVQDGLDIADELRFGAVNRLPPSVAQLKFVVGEIRRVRSEKIQLVPDDGDPTAKAVKSEFLPRLEARCAGLMSAQEAYADAMRSTDAHWIAMAGYRVGAMYRALHRDVMRVPPEKIAKSAKQKQIYFGIMHVRYRVLLEKAHDMMVRTIALGEQSLDDSAWVKRAVAVRDDIERALEEERKVIASFPFSEGEIERAIELMKEHAAKKADAERKKRGG